MEHSKHPFESAHKRLSCVAVLVDPQLTSICSTIQQNCAISDARFARNYSLCVYLLRMREFYRWRHDLPLHSHLDMESVGDWITETEENWDSVEEDDFAPLVIGGLELDPFDSDAVNQSLGCHKVVYSAGYGRMGQPHFLLARLNEQCQYENSTCYTCGIELARDSISMPAMAQGNNIYIRQDSICRLLRQMLEEWSLHEKPGPMARLVNHYQLNVISASVGNLKPVAEELSYVFREHELGEVAAGELLGNDFRQMAAEFIGCPGEHLIRAMRDLLADTLRTWPAIQLSGKAHLLDFWLAGVNGNREKWLERGGTFSRLNIDDPDAQLKQLAEIGLCEQKRWLDVAQTVVTQYRQDGIKIDIDSIVSEALKQTGQCPVQ